MTALTLLFSFVDTNAVLPNTWFASPSQQTIGYIGNRTGMISMALMPLTILFAGRNNLLLYVTGWSHGTYVILHRWIARLCVLEAILHSILELRLYVLRGTWKETQPELWWIWGSVGTVAGVVMLLASIPRRYYYEIFLITHILLAVFFIVGTWYHVVYLYNFDWGVEYWIYACVAVWFLDRLLRVWRVGKNGLQQVKITLVGEELVRVDMPGIRWSEIPGQHAYVFLPALRKWAPWENHPFSVIPSGLLRAGQSPSTSSYPPSTTSMSAETPSIAGLSCCVSKHDSKDITAAGDHADPEKSLDVAALPVDHKIARTARQRAGEKGITFFIRRRGGLTARLAATDISTPLTALIEGPYRSVHHSPILQVDRLIIIAGGVGITAVLPYVAHHRNITLHWGMRQAQQDLVEHLQPALGLVAANDRQVVLGKRLDIGRIIENEVRDGWSLIGVLVCGPGGMCDDVRKEVVRLGRVTETRLSCKWRHLRGELEIWVHASILQARVSGAWSQETDHQKEARAVYRPVSRL
jgi:predicted ferric reductase